MLKLMKKAGCISIGIGIESGCDKTLTAIKKGITTKQAKEAIRIAKQARIDFIHSTFQIGFPDETYKDIDESYNFFKKIHNDNLFCIPTIPYPGTELHKICKIGNDWDDVVNWCNRVDKNINMKLIFYYTNLKLFFYKITFGLPNLISLFFRKILLKTPW
jgi:coproporphyrinogen III oxidase-like Fe-S oxidoreductase